MSTNKKYVTYEAFGAVGDGKVDDLPAIVKAHEYANINHLDVKADDNATYYIGGKNICATIKTNTDFGKAKFIIDDVSLENHRQSCFRVVSDSEKFTPEITSLKSNQKKVDFPHEGKVLVKVVSDSYNVYIRKGLNKNSGNNIADVFVVDEDGNVIGDINWSYDYFTNIYAYKVDDEPITIKGGIFTTIANQWKSEYQYHSRNISITRSNVTVKDITHYVTGELDHGAPYAGFISVGESYNVKVKDCLLTPHRTYFTESKVPGKMVGMGTYDMTVNNAVCVNIKNINQTIDILDNRYWGLMATNFCKLLYIENCKISRFDAHCGVTTGGIKGCNLGHMGINLIGFGNFTVEDTQINRPNIINLREDYGSSFNGDVTVKNCIWRPTSASSIINGTNTGDHDFGYTCYMPRTFIIDGLTIDTSLLKDDDVLYILPVYDKNYEENKPFAYKTVEKLVVKNVKFVGKKLELRLCKDERLYPNIKNYEVETV